MAVGYDCMQPGACSAAPGHLGAYSKEVPRRSILEALAAGTRVRAVAGAQQLFSQQEQNMKGRNVNQGENLPAELYDRTTVEALLDACGGGWHGKRNRALIGVLYHSGLRVREALALEQHDIIRDERGAANLHVRCGKGSKQRVAVLRPAGLTLLDAFLEDQEGDGPIFTGFDGERLNTSAVRMLLPRLARKCGLRQRVHAHGFRHTHAFELLNAGVPTPFIKQQLGHSSLAVTERYLNHVSPSALVDAILEAS
jgi:integrase